MINETWLSTTEIAWLAGIDTRRIRKAIDRGHWRGYDLTVRDVKSRGGNSGARKEVLLTSLPPEIQLRYHEQKINPPALEFRPEGGQLIVQPAGELPDPRTLKAWQRDCQQARTQLMGYMDSLRWKNNAARPNKAASLLLAELEAGTLPEELKPVIPAALGKGRNRETLSRRTLLRWYTHIYNESADRPQPLALAPTAVKRNPIPAWGATFLKLYQHPNKPSIREATERLQTQLGPEEAPTYSQLKRFLSQLSILEREKGRIGPRELKRFRAYVARDTSGLWPTDVYTGDGHTFDAEISHPDHGRPFRPEITSIIDVASRLITGWSVALAESTWSVLDAMRQASIDHGIPAVWYTDRGSGFDNDAHRNAVTGFLARLGIRHERALPYNSQSRGLIERVHRTIWVDAAKDLPTFMGADADKERRNLIFKQTRRDLATKGHSKLLMSFPEFIQFCTQKVAEYNTRPHRSLPKILDENGAMRHVSPIEAWNLATHEGFVAIKPDIREAEDLFRPYKLAKCSRCIVTLWNNHYYSSKLEPYHGHQVQVGYDIHDAGRVWVRNLDGQLICIAEWDGNKRDYFPKAVIEQAREQREKGRVIRLQRKIDEARLEGHVKTIDAEAQPLSDEERASAAAKLQQLLENSTFVPNEPAQTVQETAELPTEQPEEPAERATDRPVFTTDIDFYRWVRGNPALATEGDREYLTQRLNESANFRFQVELESQKKTGFAST